MPLITNPGKSSHKMSESEDTPDIPREFWSEYSEQPFAACVQCDADLLADDGTGYAIQKHVVAGETVFEMAICMDCARHLHDEFSQQSRRSVVAFIRDAPERRRRQAENETDHDANPGKQSGVEAEDERREQRDRHHQQRAMSCCALCAKPRDECHRYSFGTACLARGMLTALPGSEDLGSPFLICEECEAQLNESVSAQTRDAWDRFVEDNFDGPPGLTVDPHELTLMF